MKKTKIFVIMLLVAALFAGLVACSDKKTTKTEAPTTKATEAPATDAPATTAAPEPTEAPTEAPAAALTGAIHVYSRDASSGTRGAFEELVGFEGELTDDAIVTDSNGDMAAKVGADQYAIGYVSLTTDFAANNIKAVSYEGVEPTQENVLNETYTLARPFNYVTRAAGDFGNDKKEQLVKAFIAFLTESAEGANAISSAGGIVDAAGKKPWAELKADHPIVDEDNSGIELVTVGSTSVEKAIRAALETFQPMAGNFTFKMSHAGSGEGPAGTVGAEKDSAKKGDIGFTSRPFKDTEDVSQSMSNGTFCLDAVVICAQLDNPIENLNKDTVAAIFKGEVANWEDIK
ncbi:MAG: substrate-binding domain-containing protein [Saccharofermentanales bacterium]|nr:substrate-binding domain-containing protein [Bacillota bacterium]NLB08261.1 hypothetical protein [Clostridiales bacterium]